MKRIKLHARSWRDTELMNITLSGLRETLDEEIEKQYHEGYDLESQQTSTTVNEGQIKIMFTLVFSPIKESIL